MNVDSLSFQQRRAVECIYSWYKEQKKPQFVLGGYAGTGKTTLIEYLISNSFGDSLKIAVLAYTGKAAEVLKKKGVYHATTIHSFLYMVNTEKVFQNKITYFNSKEDMEFDAIDLIICDEASMVPKAQYEDLLKLKKPILFVGDHFQLNPVTNEDFNIMKDVDFELTEVHRQAEDSIIIRLATMLRQTRDEWSVLLSNDYQQLRLKTRECLDRELLSMDQIICTYHSTRRRFNEKYRQMMGYPSFVPVVGDRVMCYENSRKHGVFNGQQFFIKEIGKIWYDGDGHMNMLVEHVDTGEVINVPTNIKCFSNSSLTQQEISTGRMIVKDQDKMPYDDETQVPFDYAYASTCHKAQGSEFDKVLIVVDSDRQSNIFKYKEPDAYPRFLYTAITRAKKELRFYKEYGM